MSASNEDDTNPQRRRPGIRNAIVAVAPNPDGFQNALERAKRLIAAEQIRKDARHGDSSRLSASSDAWNRRREFKFNLSRFRYGCWPTALLVALKIPGVRGNPQQAPGTEMSQAFLKTRRCCGQGRAGARSRPILKIVIGGTTPIPDQPDVYRLSDVTSGSLPRHSLRLVPVPPWSNKPSNAPSNREAVVHQ